MIGFAGLSHLGIVYSVATASKGFEVAGFTPDPALCSDLAVGQFPIAEPGLTELFAAARSRMTFSADPDRLRGCDVIFVSLDVQTDENNRSDLGPVRALLDLIGSSISAGTALVLLSQVPPGFSRSIKPMIGRADADTRAPFFYQVETLVFGNAIERALHPERFIVGCADPASALPPAYADWLKAFDCPVLKMRYESAELTKVAINLFLVSSVSTTNTLAEICEQIGADWREIVPALQLDKRIGPKAYLVPGLGLAGGNVERDLITVQNLSAQRGTDTEVISAWQTNSRYRRDWVLRKVHSEVLAQAPAPKLAIWGLAYKPQTHSTKNSPAIALIEAFGAIEKQAYDPQVKIDSGRFSSLTLAGNALAACRGADGLAIMTPWPEFAEVSLARVREAMRGRTVIDPFGVLNESDCVRLGFSYHRLGAPSSD